MYLKANTEEAKLLHTVPAVGSFRITATSSAALQ